MNRIFGVIMLGCIALLLGGCGNYDYSRTKDGMMYKIVKSGSGEKIKPRTYLKIHQVASIRDSVLFSTYDFIPAYGFFDSLPAATHDFLDILDEMRVGDSAIIMRSVDTLYSKGGIQYNETFKKGDQIKVQVKVLGTFKDEAAMEADRQKSYKDFENAEVVRLEKFIEDQKIKASKTPEGVFVVVEKQGSGAKVDSGLYAMVNYTGALTNGKVFDSNVDTAFGHVQPFEFLVGAKQVIEGWDIGVQQLNVGTKAKIYIPSALGYGGQAQGDKIPAFSILVFDIEILEVNAEKKSN